MGTLCDTDAEGVHVIHPPGEDVPKAAGDSDCFILALLKRNKS